MKLNKLWVESIKHFDPEIQDMLLTEQPHTRLPGHLPTELKVLGGPDCMTDLGFENLGLSKPELKEVYLAFSSAGVIIPGSSWRLRNERPLHTVVEPVDPAVNTVTLPLHWLEAVLVYGPDDVLRFVGRRVRADQLGPWVPSAKYYETNQGWVLKRGVPSAELHSR